MEVMLFLNYYSRTFLLCVFLCYKADAAHANVEDQQQLQHNMAEDLIADPISSPSLNKIIGDDDLKTSFTVSP